MRLAASGVQNLDKLPDIVLASMISAQMDADLALYYITMANLNASLGNADGANKMMAEYKRVAMPEAAIEMETREERMLREAENLDKWDLIIDLKSLPRSKNPKVLRKVEPYIPPSRRRRIPE